MPESISTESKTSKSPQQSSRIEKPHRVQRAGLDIGSDFSESTFERHADLLSDIRMSHPMYAQKKP